MHFPLFIWINKAFNTQGVNHLSSVWVWFKAVVPAEHTSSKDSRPFLEALVKQWKQYRTTTLIIKIINQEKTKWYSHKGAHHITVYSNSQMSYSLLSLTPGRNKASQMKDQHWSNSLTLGKYTYLLSCQELDLKINTALMSVFKIWGSWSQQPFSGDSRQVCSQEIVWRIIPCKTANSFLYELNKQVIKC